MIERRQPSLCTTSHMSLVGCHLNWKMLRNIPTRHETILSSFRWQLALVYLGDIVIYSKIPQEHISLTNLASTMFKEAVVALKLKNNAFSTNHINYLGHLTRLGDLRVTNHRSDAIRKLNIPTAVSEIRSFLWLCNVFKRFVPNF